MGGEKQEVGMRPWTPKDIATLEAAYTAAGERKLDLDSVAAQLGRTRSSVCQKASALGLTNKSRSKLATDPIDKRMFKGDAEALRKHQGDTLVRWRVENGHPRGMAGKTHSDDVKQKISTDSRARWEAMSEQERSANREKAEKTRRANGSTPPKHQRGSWRAGWREIGGKRNYYRSMWEANFARYLEWLRTQGEISDWAHEPETFWFDAIKRGVRSYKPDFRVWENDGSSALYEVKGWMDARSKTCLRRMAKYHPEEKLILIDSKAYRKLRSQVMGLVPGWENSERDQRA